MGRAGGEVKIIYIMKTKNIIIPLLLFCAISCTQAPQEDFEKEAKSIVQKMTLEEKVGQMAQITLDVVCQGSDSLNTLQLNQEILRDAIVNYHIGSILNCPGNKARATEWWNETIKEIQDIATTETRMKIPVLYGLDQIHGATYTSGATVFPQQIALAATFEPSHARTMGSISAYETRASNVHWTFSPVLDLGIDPRFPRQYEGFGEDPYLSSVFGYELIKGYEGDSNDVSHPHKVAACMKHFLGYSAPINGKDRTPAYIPKSTLLEYHVPAFQAAVDAGVHTVMINSGLINNIPVHADPELLVTLLREEMGFKGMIVTDWEDINKLYTRDRIVPSIKEAIKTSINAGIDMSMIPYNYREFCTNLIELVNEKEVPMSRIDEAVTRIIALKLKLDLFDNPNTFAKDYPKFAAEESKQAAYNAAADAITLLKNKEDVLPLEKGKKILLTGPNVVSKRSLNGGWTFSWQGEKIEEFAGDYPNLLQAMQAEFGENNIVYVPGVSYTDELRYDTEHKDCFEEAIAAAQKVDYVVLCLGENSYCEKPGDLRDLHLNELQTALAQELQKSGKKLILVLSEGRPRVINRIVEGMDAIVQSYLPGLHGAEAIADVLSGDVNPSGKLPYTYPAAPNDLTPYYHKYSEEQQNVDDIYFYEDDFKPEFHFGYGLSYTNFIFSNFTINRKELPLESKEEIIVTIDVRNEGKREGKEVVQLYTRDLYASLTPDVQRLRRFQKINLKPGETKKVEFHLQLNDFSFINLNNKRVVEPGEFVIQVGNASCDVQAHAKFVVK